MQIEIPQRVVCDAEHCPMHNECSRFSEYLRLKDTELYLWLLNKSQVSIDETGCQHLHIPQSIIAARGFRNMYGTIPKKNATNIWKRYPEDISRRQFYRLLSGEVLLMPDTQETILSFLKEKGADTSIGFDNYEKATI